MWHDAHRAAGEPSAWWWCAAVSVARGLVALRADGVALGAQLEGMRVVAVAAGDPAREHLALAERLVVEDLAHHLAVSLEQAGLEQGGEVAVEELAARAPRLVQLRPPGV